MEPQLPQLPEAVVANILQQVLPLRARLHCALVCSAWAAAVACTTADLDAQLSSCIRWEHVQDWLEQHAGQVSSIHFSHHGHSKQLLQLPCARLLRLQRLHVDSMTMRLQETGEGQHTGGSTALQDCCEAFCSSCALVSTQDSAAAGGMQQASARAVQGSCTAPAGSLPPLLPQLFSLELFSCAVSLRDMLLLSQVTSLTALNLYYTTVTADGSSTAPASEEQLTAAMSAVLQGLTGLRQLCISLMQFGQHALFPISSMTGLQSLQLYVSTDDEHTDGFLASLPASLTSLHLKDMSVTPSSPAVAQQLSSLSSLQSLRLEELDLGPSVLSAWTGLQTLVLDAVYPVPPARQNEGNSSSALQQPETDDFNRGMQALLGALQQLPHLQHLELSRMQLDEVTAVEQLSTLTASSKLTSLHLLARFSMPLPRGALQQLLPSGLQLPGLRVLRLQGGDGVSEEQCLDSDDVICIAASCPGLTELTLHGVVSLNVSLAPLLALQPSLQALSVAGAAFGDAAAGVVTQLTGLQSLDWSNSGLTDGGLRQLTALTGLTRLRLKSCKDVSREILPPDEWYKASELVLEAAGGGGAQAGAPDVWSQLQQLCLRSSP